MTERPIRGGREAYERLVESTQELHPEPDPHGFERGLAPQSDFPNSDPWRYSPQNPSHSNRDHVDNDQ